MLCTAGASQQLIIYPTSYQNRQSQPCLRFAGSLLLHCLPSWQTLIAVGTITCLLLWTEGGVETPPYIRPGSRFCFCFTPQGLPPLTGLIPVVGISCPARNFFFSFRSFYLLASPVSRTDPQASYFVFVSNPGGKSNASFCWWEVAT